MRSSSNAWASWRSGVPNPSLNQPSLHGQRPAPQDGPQGKPERKPLVCGDVNSGLGSRLRGLRLAPRHMEETSMEEGKRQAIGICHLLSKRQRLLAMVQGLVRI